jgi:hypothetical protein
MAVAAASVAVKAWAVIQRGDFDGIRGSFARCQAHARAVYAIDTRFDVQRGF